MTTLPSSPSGRLYWYCRWLDDEASTAVCVLIPERFRHKESAILHTLGPATPIWYEVDGTQPRIPSPYRGHVWLLSGSRLPMVNFSAATSEVRRNGSDVLVFGAPTQNSTARYAETVFVNDADEVIRFQRYYDDSPKYTDPWTGQASFVVTDARSASSVVSHVLHRGWGLDSIGAMTRRFSVRWSDSPCEFSIFESSSLFQGPISLSESVATADTIQEHVVDLTKNKEKAKKTNVESSTFESTIPHILNFSQSAPASADGSSGKYRDRAYLVCKRVFDFTVSLLGILALSPLLMVMAIAVKLTSKGPILFSHTRQGRGGREFSCLKFRSMTQGAVDLQDQLRKANEVDGPQFKIENDPRQTKIGGWLRRYNMDELPQLFNVLAGQMSLVGPRPSPDDENRICPAWRRTRLSVKPGITGLWQVLRRRETPESDFQEWIYYDVEYAKHRSLWLDFQLLIHTPIAMFAPHRLDGFIARLRRRGICIYSDEIYSQGLSN